MPLTLFTRSDPLFQQDLLKHEQELAGLISSSRFLVIGGAGKIGSVVTQELFRRKPELLHVVDYNENNIEELVYDIENSIGRINGFFDSFAIDSRTDIFDSFMGNSGRYDYIINLAGANDRIMPLAKENGAAKYFSPEDSTQMIGRCDSLELSVSSARLDNICYSDGNLFSYFKQRMENNQPLNVPDDMSRCFITPHEAGVMCLIACLLGENREVFFPKQYHRANPENVSAVAERYLHFHGYEPVNCKSEDEGHDLVNKLKTKKKYPVYFNEKKYAPVNLLNDSYLKNEKPDMKRFHALAVIQK